ncbi:MAG: hypothetical protein WEC75_02980 [Dehalococcoidia bacterium]
MSDTCIAPGGRVEVVWTAIDRKNGDILVLAPVTANNQRYSDYEWQYVQQAGGRVIFPIGTPGTYEFRLLRSGTHIAVSPTIRSERGCEAIRPGTNSSGYSAAALSGTCATPGARIEFSWQAIDRRNGDLIVVLPATVRNDKYADYEWNYVQTAGGSAVFTAPANPGPYEFRLIRSGSHLAVSELVTVGAC